MLPHFALPLDPGLAALLGAMIGAGASVIVQIVAAVVAAKHETRAFRRTLQKETIASVTDAYVLTLNVIFNMQRGGAPTKEAYSDIFAQIALRGTPEVKRLVSQFQALHPNERPEFDVQVLVQAMQQHLTQLQGH